MDDNGVAANAVESTVGTVLLKEEEIKGLLVFFGCAEVSLWTIRGTTLLSTD
jgi:hypothetical protein